MGDELARIGAPSLPAMPGADLMAAVLAALKPTTVRAYRADLEDFAAHVGAASGETAARLLVAGGPGPANGAALAYKSAMLARDLAPATINRRLAALRKICETAATLGWIAWTLRVRGVRGEAREDRRGPDRGHWRGMLATAEAEAAGGEPKPVRDLAIVRTLHDLALRRAELAGLDLADVDLADAAVWVVGKGRRERQRLSVPGPTLAALADWIACRGSEPGPVFIRLDRGAIYLGPTRLDPESVNRLVKALGIRSGVPRPTRAHGLRHAAITAALDAGHDVRRVRKFSRHASIKMVVRYDDARGDVFGSIAAEVAEGG